MFSCKGQKGSVILAKHTLYSLFIRYYNKRLEELEPHGKDSDIIYGKPYCRIQSYMVGVLAGYILYRHFFVKKVKIHWVRRWRSSLLLYLKELQSYYMLKIMFHISTELDRELLIQCSLWVASHQMSPSSKRCKSAAGYYGLENYWQQHTSPDLYMLRLLCPPKMSAGWVREQF